MTSPKLVADWIIHNSSEVLTVAGPAPWRSGDPFPIIAQGVVALGGGRILAAGTAAEVRARITIDSTTRYYDAQCGVVTPGLVDPHTHLCYAGSRQHELASRLAGRSYLEILAGGGGILHTMRATRQASDEALLTATRERMCRLLAHGVTSLEIKSGYGLSLEGELRQLRLLAQLASQGPQLLVSTFMGAHATPPEYAGSVEDYVDLVIDEMLPRAAELASYCDVFCEPGAFTVPQSRRILTRARELGLGLKLHADELTPSGGAQLAAELGATTAEHLLQVDDMGMAALGRAGVMAVLLPGTSFYLGRPYAPARALERHGVALALATDANPGSSPTENPQLMLNLACLYLGMTPASAWAAATINAACAIGLASEVGSLVPGKRADVVVFAAPDHLYVPYHYGNNLAQAVFCGGRLVSGVPPGEESKACAW